MSSKSKIVILEDDSQLAMAMTQVIQKQGFEVVAVSRAEEIQSHLSQQNVQMIYIDCLLPNENGIDVAKQIRSQFPVGKLDIVMMSGLFTDPHFVKDAIRSTQALGFLKKPFSMTDVISYLKPLKIVTAPPMTQHKVEVLSPRKSLYLLFSKNPVSIREKRKAIEALDEVHGFDLPYLYSLLAETQSSGHLNIVNAETDVSGITFSDGHIVAVDVVDQGTFLGKLLIDAGFVLPDDLNTALNSSNPKRLGEKLISQNFISPHGFLVAMENQMNIRLSRTIRDEKFKVNFVNSEVPLTNPSIDVETLGHFLHDWVASKISVDWLKSQYIQWGNYTVKKSPIFDSENEILKMPLISGFPGVLEFILSGKTLSQIVDDQNFPQAALYKALHLLLTKGFITFEDMGTVSEGDRLLKLKHIIDQFYGKNKFEIFDVIVKMVGSLDRNLESVKSEFYKILGPQPSGGADAISIHEQIMSLVQESFNAESNGGKEKIKEDLARVDVEAKLKASSQYEEAKNKLQKGQYMEALRIIEKCLEVDPNINKGRIYISWARLAAKGNSPQKIQVLKEVEVDMMQVPPEEKLDAIYSFVMGIYYKVKGDLPMSKKSFEKAVHLDGDLISARRELSVLQSQENSSNKKNDVLNADLKDLVSNFFRKK